MGYSPLITVILQDMLFTSIVNQLCVCCMHRYRKLSSPAAPFGTAMELLEQRLHGTLYIILPTRHFPPPPRFLLANYSNGGGMGWMDIRMDMNITSRRTTVTRGE